MGDKRIKQNYHTSYFEGKEKKWLTFKLFKLQHIVHSDIAGHITVIRFSAESAIKYQNKEEPVWQIEIV